MSYKLALAETQDEYLQVLTMDNMTDVLHVSFTVINAPVYMQWRSASGATDWETEVFRVPGIYNLNRQIIGVRFRSGIIGMPAMIQAECLTSAD